ncbi:YhcB family protein [Mannheimia sp. AT1]|uniref:Z-ring associated protein G n=1 Tax=Mannheimia cairinae TaxID=3025936 RepID=A0ABT5MLG5_9PAST|nr:YhcB family protein [Mannheimia cairinae]MDD0823034.1 YhcB family protein [Mannheimia cairinae]MDD0825941.1 YhcB family protein [Mannheimia cairinae]
MEQWSMDIWAAICAALIIGIIIGSTLVRAFHSGVKKQHELEAELKETKTQVDEQKQKLEQHFEQSAQLLSTLATDYKKLYAHLAQSSEQLLPEATKNIELFQQAQLSVQSEEKTEEDQPRDYSEGSSGLLKS